MRLRKSLKTQSRKKNTKRIFHLTTHALRSSVFRAEPYLYVGQRGSGVMAEPADQLAGVTVIVRVASVRRVQAQFAAVVQRAHVLVHRVDGLQYAARELFELAQLDRLVHAVVLQVVHPGGRLEHPLSGHRQPVHVGHFALGRGVVVVGRPARKNTNAKIQNVKKQITTKKKTVSPCAFR